MSLITEDGTGLSAAESLCSVDDSLTYHANRGNTTWATITTAQQEQALRRATDYMEEVFREKWAGFRNTTTQTLCWPRAWVPMKDAPSGYVRFAAYYPSTVVPPQVANACAELALRAASGDLMPDLTQAKISTSIAGITVNYDRFSQRSPEYKHIKGMLRPFLKLQEGAVAMVRS